MPSDPIPLELAAFLDSPGAQSSSASPRDRRRFGSAILEACYQDLGIAPRLLDGESATQLLRQCLPARLERGAKEAALAEELLDAFLGHLRDTQVVPQAFEIAQAVNENQTAFRDAVTTGTGVPAAPVQKTDPFQHGAPKTGRNDPCFCGSGKKFKKCHGKA